VTSDGPSPSTAQSNAWKPRGADSGGRASRLQLLGLPQLGHDLLHAVALRAHRTPPFGVSKIDDTAHRMDQSTGGRTLVRRARHAASMQATAAELVAVALDSLRSRESDPPRCPATSRSICTGSPTRRGRAQIPSNLESYPPLVARAKP